jgi:Ion channel
VTSSRERVGRIWRPWIQFWATDKSLSALLLMLIVAALVLPPLIVAGVKRSILSDVVFSLLFVSGMAAVWSEGRMVFRVVTTLTLGSLAAKWLTRLAPGGEFAIWNAAADMLALASFTLVVLAKVVRPGTITSHRIQGAVAVYLLLGLVWANAYEWTDLANPGAFTGAGASGAQDASWIYYSFVTLTTMGYGDITPVHPVARSLAAAEALTGQLYIAILISRLVALEVDARRNS